MRLRQHIIRSVVSPVHTIYLTIILVILRQKLSKAIVA
jgi:hypothetical protein